MALQNQTFANSGNPYYGKPSDWSLYSTLNSTIHFNDTNAVLRVIPAVPDSQTTITFNGEQLAYLSDIPDLANWAQFPANNNVTIPSPYALEASLANISTVNVSTLNVFQTNVTTINVSTLNADVAHISSIESSTLNITADRGASLFPSFVNINTSNGLYGSIDLTANPGLGGAGGGNVSLTANGGTAPGGLYGQVSIVANEGTATVSGTNVTTGGYINIQANSGSITSPTLTSRIDLNAGGLNLYSGLLSPIASEFGYTFVNASAGVSVVAGAFSPSFQVPGSVYLYGTTGVVLGSDAYAGDIYPKFDGINPPDNLSINGRTELVGSAFVDVNDINQLSFSGDVNASKAITGLSTINGLPMSEYVYDPTPAFSTVTINFDNGVRRGFLETTQIKNTTAGSDLNINQENGTGDVSMAVFVPPSGTATGEVRIRGNGQIELNRIVAGDGILINPTGDTLSFETAGAPKGQIDGLSTINGNDVNNPQLSTITMNINGVINTDLIRNEYGSDFNIRQNLDVNNLGNLNIGLYRFNQGPPHGEIKILNTGDIRFNNVGTSSGIRIPRSGDTINFETGGNPTGQILGLSTINGISVTNPIVNVLRANEIRTNTPDLASLMRINMATETADAMTLVHPQTGATRGVKIVEAFTGPGILDVGSLTSVSTINGIQYPPTSFVDSLQIYVAPNGNDLTGTGSQQKPFLSIGQALTARALLSTTVEVSIILASGTYTENPTLVRNTYLVGVQTGDQRQPCNVTGNIVMNDTTGTMGISGLQVNGSVSMNGVGGVYSVFGCNIAFNGTAIAANSGTVTITECRISNSLGTCITSASTLLIRDCLITTTNSSSCINGSASTTIRQCVIQSSTATGDASPLVNFNNVNPASTEISFCILQYLNDATDTVGNKCCIRFQGASTNTSMIFNCLLLCEGAITASGGNIQCIQDTGVGAVNMAYGQLSAGNTANHISPNVNKAQFVSVA